MRLDGSQEFWRYDENDTRQYTHQLFQQDYLPKHIEPSMLENGFHGAIAQASWPSTSENDFLADIKKASRFVLAATGWVDLTADNALAKVSQYQGELAGFRWWYNTQHPDFDEAALTRGIKWLGDFDFTLDISLADAEGQRAISQLADCAEQRCIIDLSAILRADIDLDHWRVLISGLGQQKNHYFKLTGLAEKVTAPDYDDQMLDVETVAPFLDIMLNQLGSDRLIYASGWPHSNLSATYDEIYDITNALIEPLSMAEQAAIMGVNAAQCYGLG